MSTETKGFSKVEEKEKCILNPMPNFSLEQITMLQSYLEWEHMDRPFTISLL